MFFLGIDFNGANMVQYLRHKRNKKMSKAIISKPQSKTLRTPHIRRPILSEDVVPFSECRRKLAEYIERGHRNHRPIIITQNGRPSSVLMNIVDWEDMLLAENINETVELFEDVRVAEEEIGRGEFTSHEDFMNELRAEGRL